MVLHLDAWYAPAVPRLKWSPKHLKFVTVKEEEHEKKHDKEHGHGDAHSVAESEESEEEEEEQEGAWMFLFIDLVLVAMTSKCALVMEYCSLSIHSFLFSATAFTVMFLTRQYIDDHCNRFFANDAFHRFLYFAYCGSFFIMALNVNSVENHSHLDYKCKANLYGLGFGVAFLMTRGIMCLFYLSVMYHEPVLAFEQFTGPLVRNVMSMTMVIMLMIAESQATLVGNKGPFPPANRIYIYLIAIMIEWGYDLMHLACLLARKSGMNIPNVILCLEYYPLTLEVYQERLGAFIMLVLGESMICLLIPYFNVEFAMQTYTFHLVSYCIIFAYGLMYYDSSNHAESEAQHAVNHSLLSAYFYFWIHVFIGLAVFYTSAAMGILYLSEVATDAATGTRRLLNADGTYQPEYLYDRELLLSGGGVRLARELGGQETLDPDPTPEDDQSFPKIVNGKIVAYSWAHRPMCKPVSLLAASCGMAVIFMSLMRALHSGIEIFWQWDQDNAERTKERWSLAWRLGSGAFHFSIPLFGLKHPIQNASIHMVLLLLMLVLEIKTGVHAHEKEGSAHGGHGKSMLHGGGLGHGHAPRKFRFPVQSAAAILMSKDPRASEALRRQSGSGARNSISQRRSITDAEKQTRNSDGSRASIGGGGGGGGGGSVAGAVVSGMHGGGGHSRARGGGGGDDDVSVAGSIVSRVSLQAAPPPHQQRLSRGSVSRMSAIELGAHGR